MLHMDTEAELLQDAPLPFYHLILQVHIVLIEDQRSDGSEKQKNRANLAWGNGWC